MEDEKELNNLISSINKEIDEIKDNPTKTKELPSTFKILLSGISSQGGINTLFSPEIDKILENFVDLFISGKIDTLLLNEEKLKEIFETIGIGEGSFEGPISKTVIASIQNSMQSFKYLKMKSKLRKMMLVFKELKQKAKNFHGEDRKKYDEAVYSCKQLLRIIQKVYKNRKLVNERMKKGLSYLLKEGENISSDNEKIERIE